MSDLLIHQRETDKYLFVTPICQKYGKKFNDYFNSQATKRKILRVEESAVFTADLVIIVRIGQNHLRGTYIHPKLIPHFSRWVSEEFGDIMDSYLANPPPPRGFYFPRRSTWLEINAQQIPYNYFAIAGAFMDTLGEEFRFVNYKLPECIIPEISVGRGFPIWFEKEHGYTMESKQYRHRCSTGKITFAKMYPMEHLTEFKKFIFSSWFVNKAWGYFAERDKGALPFLDSLVKKRGLPQYEKPLLQLEEGFSDEDFN